MLLNVHHFPVVVLVQSFSSKLNPKCEYFQMKAKCTHKRCASLQLFKLKLLGLLCDLQGQLLSKMAT